LLGIAFFFAAVHPSATYPSPYWPSPREAKIANEFAIPWLGLVGA
jgi:hypothetical protein